MYGKNTYIETRHYDSIINEGMDEIKPLKKPFMFLTIIDRDVL